MKRLYFYPFNDLPTLVIHGSSSVEFSFQVGGSACWKRTVEGVVYPLALTGHASAEALGAGLHELMHERVGLDGPLADAIDYLLSSFKGLPVRVDREKLNESCDQWIYVIVEEGESGSMGNFDLPLHSVLTW